MSSFNIFSKTISEDEVIIYIEGELDIFTIDTVIQKVDEQTVSNCQLDLKDLSFIDSSGIGLLIRKVIDWKDENRHLSFVNLRQNVEEVMEEMGVFTILEDVLN
ncbi:STAS domain-containing protein [Filobacillus milosensis]|uniref:STAS domain-containing protein n=1 Tax=Filobacillus milosensis TaxID=94137 RepID=UPI001890F25A|nr:STAS domain-containing protein [Filobacillus milosensis]